MCVGGSFRKIVIVLEKTTERVKEKAIYCQKLDYRHLKYVRKNF